MPRTSSFAVLTIVTLAGCTRYLDPSAGESELARGTGLTLSVSLVGGGPAVLTVTGLDAGEIAVIGRASAIGSSCPAAAAGVCLDLGAGARILGRPAADATGAAVLETMFPPELIGRHLVVQAMALRGASSIVSNVVEGDVAPPLADADADGWDPAVDCDDGDPTVHPGADELCNGRDDDCDALTVETGAVSMGGTAFASIGAAAAFAVYGDVIEACDGTFVETVTVPNGVTLRGRGASLTVIDGGGDGPVIEAQSATTIEDLTVTGGQHRWAGGGLYVPGCEVVLRRLEVIGNHAGTSGGGVYSNCSTTVLEDVLLEGNSADSGGGAYLFNDLATRLIVRGNTAGNGGGLRIANVTNNGLECVDCEVVDNTAEDQGGGVYVLRQEDDYLLHPVRFTRGVIANNAAGDEGGGVYLGGSSGVVLDGTSVTSNSATFGGGAYLTRFEPWWGDPPEPSGLEAIGADFGSGATENTPNDIHGSGGAQASSYGAGASFECSESTCW